jgi:hypothetical protein
MQAGFRYTGDVNIELAQEIVSTYEKHGWKLQRLLLRSSSGQDRPRLAEAFPNIALVDSEIDAVWFARQSHGGREAWELRSIAQQPYALFETFEVDEIEEDREDARREMENKMREHGAA